MKMNMKMKSEKYILKMTTFGLQKDRIKKNIEFEDFGRHFNHEYL